MNIRNLIIKNAKKLNRFVIKESPTILTVLGVSGVGTTIIYAIKGTRSAIYLLDKYYYDRGDPDFKLKPIEMVKLTWKCYIPTVISGAATISCIIGANSINLRRNAALVSLYTITETSLKEYQEKVIDLIGARKEENLRDDIAQDHLNKDPVEGKTIILTGKGPVLFYDSLSGQYFQSDMEAIRKAQNDFNLELLGDGYKVLNDFYYLIGLEPTELGADIGWDTDHGFLDIHFSAKIATNGTPCIVLNYNDKPRNL